MVMIPYTRNWPDILLIDEWLLENDLKEDRDYTWVGRYKNKGYSDIFFEPDAGIEFFHEEDATLYLLRWGGKNHGKV